MKQELFYHDSSTGQNPRFNRNLRFGGRLRFGGHILYVDHETWYCIIRVFFHYARRISGSHQLSFSWICKGCKKYTMKIRA